MSFKFRLLSFRPSRVLFMDPEYCHATKKFIFPRYRGRAIFTIN